MSSIALRQYKFNVGPFDYAHNFLVLYDDQGNVVEELHGQPADPSLRERAREVHWSHKRQPWSFWKSRQGRLYRDEQDERLLWQGSDAMARWQAAKEAVSEINNRKLTYNLWGSDLNGPRDWDAPRPPAIAGNSNSVNRALIDAMGLRLPSMPTSAPGIENQLLPQSLLDQIRRNNGRRAVSSDQPPYR